MIKIIHWPSLNASIGADTHGWLGDTARWDIRSKMWIRYQVSTIREKGDEKDNHEEND